MVCKIDCLSGTGLRSQEIGYSQGLTRCVCCPDCDRKLKTFACVTNASSADLFSPTLPGTSCFWPWLASFRCGPPPLVILGLAFDTVNTTGVGTADAGANRFFHLPLRMITTLAFPLLFVLAVFPFDFAFAPVLFALVFAFGLGPAFALVLAFPSSGSFSHSHRAHFNHSREIGCNYKHWCPHRFPTTSLAKHAQCGKGAQCLRFYIHSFLPLGSGFLSGFCSSSPPPSSSSSSW